MEDVETHTDTVYRDKMVDPFHMYKREVCGDTYAFPEIFVFVSSQYGISIVT